MLRSLDAQLIISRNAKEASEDEIIELLEKKDERFRKMGTYFRDEMHEALQIELQRLKMWDKL